MKKAITTTSHSDAMILAGQIANRHAAASVFDDYQSRKSSNTRRRHGADLALFASFLGGAGLELDTQALQNQPEAWTGITWGIVEGYKRWMIAEGYAIASINSRLSTIKTYARLAFKAGAIGETEAALIRMVEGYSHKDGKHLDAGRRVKRRGVKKASAVTISAEQARALKSQPDTPQGRRDALLMCLLLDHGLRCGEVAALEVDSINRRTGEMTFYRAKVDKVQIHKLTADTVRAAWAWFESGDAPTTGPLLRASMGKGAGSAHWKELGAAGMSERAITKRVRDLGRAAGLQGLSAHDCRHYWATRASRAGVDTLRLMQAGGWTSPAMPARYVEASKIANEGMPGVD